MWGIVVQGGRRGRLLRIALVRLFISIFELVLVGENEVVIQVV
jgi:hypothetical protein